MNWCTSKEGSDSFWELPGFYLVHPNYTSGFGLAPTFCWRHGFWYDHPRAVTFLFKKNGMGEKEGNFPSSFWICPFWGNWNWEGFVQLGWVSLPGFLFFFSFFSFLVARVTPFQSGMVTYQEQLRPNFYVFCEKYGVTTGNMLPVTNRFPFGGTCGVRYGTQIVRSVVQNGLLIRWGGEWRMFIPPPLEAL